MNILAQIVIPPESMTALLTAGVALQIWIVRRLFQLDKGLALIRQQLNNCVCRNPQQQLPQPNDDL